MRRHHLILRLQAMVDQDLQHIQMMKARSILNLVQAVALVTVIRDRQVLTHLLAPTVLVVVVVVVETLHIVTGPDIHLVLV